MCLIVYSLILAEDDMYSCESSFALAILLKGCSLLPNGIEFVLEQSMTVTVCLLISATIASLQQM